MQDPITILKANEKEAERKFTFDYSLGHLMSLKRSLMDILHLRAPNMQIKSKCFKEWEKKDT